MARDAVSQCNWVVGECASKWTQRYAKNRTDGDFGQMVGLSGDQIFQRRRVWEAFGEDHQKYGSLKWSFFYVALNWDDAEDCLHAEVLLPDVSSLAVESFEEGKQVNS